MDHTPDPSSPRVGQQQPVDKPPAPQQGLSREPLREPGAGPLLAPRRPRLTADRKTAIGVGTALLLVAVLWATAASSGDDKPDPGAPARWLDHGGQTAITQISTDLKAMAAAPNFAAIVEACTTFKTNLQKAQALGPIPDPEAQQRWSAGLAAAIDGADACTIPDPASTRMEDDFTEANTDFAKLRTRLLQLARDAG
ncbi:hypothetical protein [Kitasatospora sp. CMC57]